MNASSVGFDGGVRFELRFHSLSNAARVYSFPCDATGRVDMDTLSARERDCYLYARAVVGGEFSMPEKQCCAAA